MSQIHLRENIKEHSISQNRLKRAPEYKTEREKGQGLYRKFVARYERTTKNLRGGPGEMHEAYKGLIQCLVIGVPSYHIIIFQLR